MWGNACGEMVFQLTAAFRVVMSNWVISLRAQVLCTPPVL